MLRFGNGTLSKKQHVYLTPQGESVKRSGEERMRKKVVVIDGSLIVKEVPAREKYGKYSKP